MSIDENTTWQEVFDNSQASEQDCIRDALDASLAAALEQPVTEDYWSEKLYPCLNPGIAPEIYLTYLLAEIGAEGWVAGESEVSCLREMIGEIDVAALVGAEDSAEYAEVIGHLIACVPDVFVSLLIGEFDLSLEDMNRNEVSCLRTLMEEPSTFVAMSGPEDSAEYAEVIGHLIACVPDVFVSLLIGEFGLSLEDMSEDETSCLRDLLTSDDLPGAFAAPEGSAEYEGFFERLATCVTSAF